MDIYAASLPGCPGLGAKSIRNLISAFGSAEDVWKASDESVRKAHLLSPKAEDSFLSYRAHTSPQETEELLYRLEIRCCTWEDENYPPLLAETSNPPAVLFYKGQPPVWEKTIAVVGMRKATPYGLETANRISSNLAKAGVTIVSGGARGIDSASHKGALAGQNPTVVVLACGLDKVYPPENKNLFQEVISTGGALISEYPPGTPPLGRQFPARNRIIAGMSRGILVVEAAERSGALITSDFALEEGRDVFSVPGNIWLPSSKGTNRLVRNGAICCTTAKDILSEYNWLSEEAGTEKVSYEELTLEEEVVYRFCCIGDEVTAEEILVQSGMPVTKISTLLLQLQLKGYIKEIDPGRFVMTGK